MHKLGIMKCVVLWFLYTFSNGIWVIVLKIYQLQTSTLFHNILASVVGFYRLPYFLEKFKSISVKFNLNAIQYYIN